MDLKREALGTQGTWKCTIVWKMKVISGAWCLWSRAVDGRTREWILESLINQWPHSAAQREEDQPNNLSGFRSMQEVVGGFLHPDWPHISHWDMFQRSPGFQEKGWSSPPPPRVITYIRYTYCIIYIIYDIRL